MHVTSSLRGFTLFAFFDAPYCITANRERWLAHLGEYAIRRAQCRA